jgi:peptidoglycan/LPS O-acetylase OafA/YrhL
MRVEKNAHAVRVSAKGHLPVLDGVRAIAVLLVIAFHFWQGFTLGPYSLIGRLAVWGQTGVDLFFVLSGFLITGILLDSKGSEHFLRNFYSRRILRIFPLYYATLFAIYLVCPLLHVNQWTNWKQSIWFWIYLQNIPATFAPALEVGPGHFWSLAVEEHYYLFWPLLVMLLTRDKLLRVIGLAIAISLLTRVLLLRYATFYFTMARLDGLAIGSALAIFARDRPAGLARFVGLARRLLCFLGLTLIVAQLFVSGRSLSVIQIVKSTLIAVVYACVMILTVQNAFGRGVERLLSGRLLGTIGKYSYGMYVLHPFILSGLHEAGLSYSIAGLSVSILVIYIAAWISWTLLEKRFLGLKRHFEYGSSRQNPDFSSLAKAQ